MDAIIISVKGDLKPIALRHHVFEKGNTLGICGFLNYRKDMFELLIHAEGENDAMIEFTIHINKLVKAHRLVISTESATFENFTGFKISHLDVSLNHKFEDSYKRLNPDSINIPFAQSQETEQMQITNNKNQLSGYKKILSFLKQAGLW